MIGIYKITNKITTKSYIGQSINIIDRWEDEKIAAYDKQNKAYSYPLSQAIRKYGLDNFSFEVIEECKREELNQKEQYWIKYYDTYNNGYNQTIGGDTVLHMCKLTPEQAGEIAQILIKDQEGNVSHKQLAIQYNVSKDTIQAINAGRQWYNDKYTYPLHKSKYDGRFVLKHLCIDCGVEISSQAIRCKECEKKHRKIEFIKQLPVTKEKLQQLLVENNGNFTKVGKLFNITDNALRKWCKNLELPTHSKEYQIPKEKKTQDYNYRKPVRCIEENMVFNCAADGARWLVQQGKSKSLNSSKNAIPKVCQGKAKSHLGYHWEYVE